MADTEKRKESENVGRGSMWREYRNEVLAALAIIVVVIGVAFWVNNFFYGFDPTEIAIRDTTVQTGEKKEPAKAEFKQSDDWRLILVNRDHPLEEEYSGELTELRYGQSVDSRIYPDLQAMFDEMRADGLSPKVAEGYRSREDQAQKLSDKIDDPASTDANRACSTAGLFTIAEVCHTDIFTIAEVRHTVSFLYDRRYGF